MPFGADCIPYYAEFADKLYDEIAPTGPKDVALVRREPLGVVAAIVPWNYPLIIAAWKLGPALLAGNSVVLKPAEQSPLTAHPPGRAGPRGRACPPGVLNVVPGFGEEAGKPLALHGDVDMVTFTGSTEVGKLMLRYAGESNMKRVALECGGKSPHVVMRDADLDAAASRHRLGHLLQPGRDLPRRLARDRASQRQGRLLERSPPSRATRSRSATRFEPATQMGALIDAGPHASRARLYRQRHGARARACALGGKRAFEEYGGFYVEATILDGVRPDMRVAREEIFGPVLTVTTFARRGGSDCASPTIRIYGLAAAVWTRDMNVAHRLSRRAASRHGLGQHLRSLIAGHARSAASSSPASAATARPTPSTSTPI